MNEWKERAACKGLPLEIFFEQYQENPELARRVDEVCEHCPVKQQCLRMGINSSGSGVHGGIYLVLGRYSKINNKHKDLERIIECQDLVEEMRDERHWF